jgi:hypothetical protein
VERLAAGVGNDPRGHTEALPIVREYLARERLSKIGYLGDINSLPAWKADCFEAIAVQIESVREKKNKKRR